MIFWNNSSSPILIRYVYKMLTIISLALLQEKVYCSQLFIAPYDPYQKSTIFPSRKFYI